MGAKSFFIHPVKQDKALISQQVLAVLKLLVVLVCSSWCLNRATEHRLYRDDEQKHPLPPVYVHTVGLIGSQLRGEKGNATRPGCAWGTDTL